MLDMPALVHERKCKTANQLVQGSKYVGCGLFWRVFLICAPSFQCICLDMQDYYQHNHYMLLVRGCAMIVETFQ